MTAAKGTKSTRLTDAPKKSLSARWKNSLGLSPISSEPLLIRSRRLFAIFTGRDDNTASAAAGSFRAPHLVPERAPLDEEAQEELPPPDEQQHGLEPAAHVVQLLERAQRHVAAQDRERERDERRPPAPAHERPRRPDEPRERHEEHRRQNLHRRPDLVHAVAREQPREQRADEVSRQVQGGADDRQREEQEQNGRAQQEVSQHVPARVAREGKV